MRKRAESGIEAPIGLLNARTAVKIRGRAIAFGDLLNRNAFAEQARASV
jgi:hypothetical protein